MSFNCYRLAPRDGGMLHTWSWKLVVVQLNTHKRTWSAQSLCLLGSTLEKKACSLVWKTKDEPSPRKFKMEYSAGNVMLMVFWDYWGLIYTEFGTDASKTRMAIMTETYSDTLLRMGNAIKEQRHCLFSWTAFLFHGNAGLHRAKLIKNLIADLK